MDSMLEQESEEEPNLKNLRTVLIIFTKNGVILPHLPPTIKRQN
jgi:hypothetical protein